MKKHAAPASPVPLPGPPLPFSLDLVSRTPMPVIETPCTYWFEDEASRDAFLGRGK